ncbi:hypothetical protein GCM10010289_38730 [Streptomyces violascens]|uniref:Transposase n=1 Tax=Streptomyces violascens TaxID=67381 RepID=A0ABQ3QXD8_9ACTN|nr:hypothetical protein GCM10010289_38730 [Streptomyces violascens]GHI41923.1 hypothetical protein Sviol_63310 [Streptomyces violascens]
MARCAARCVCPFGAELARYRAIPGGVDSDGRPVRKPGELIAAETILRLCDRFHCLPSQILAEDASILRLLEIEKLGTPPQTDPE